MLGATLDLGIDLDVWPWVWLAIAVFFAVIELTVLAGSFVLLPFAVSAFAASLAGFYDASIEVQWAIFIIFGSILWIVLYRYAQAFAGNHDIAPGVGADRLVGLTGIVTAEIDPDDSDRKGRVTIQGEVWGALAAGDDGIPLHTRVKVLEMLGTRVVVTPVDIEAPGAPENQESS
jgi:membrane protein implicated in regulation of membrane protease activity